MLVCGVVAGAVVCVVVCYLGVDWTGMGWMRNGVSLDGFCLCIVMHWKDVRENGKGCLLGGCLF